MENRCVCCGEIILEGRLVCMLCEIMAGSENDLINRRRSYGDIRSGQREAQERERAAEQRKWYVAAGSSELEKEMGEEESVNEQGDIDGKAYQRSGSKVYGE